MTEEPSEVRELRELVESMPALALEADTEAVSTDLDLLALKDWADRTIESAERAGRHDVGDKVRAMLRRLEVLDAKAAAATQRRRAAESNAREVLRRIDSGGSSSG